MKAFDLEAEIKIDIASANASLDTLIKKAKELNTELNATKSAGSGTSGSGTGETKTGKNDSNDGGIDWLGSTLSVTLGSLSASAVRAIGGAIKGAISDGFNYNIERDSYISSLQTILNTSREEATALYDNLAKISLDTPLNQASIGYASERLLNFGFPREGLEEMIIDLGNLSRGDNEKMERITKALSDTLSKRFLQAQERNQFADAGVDIWGLLDAYYSSTDKDWASLTDEEKSDEFIYRQKNKLLPAADVVAAIQYASDTPGMPYYNAMELAMNTTGGALERYGESLVQFSATVLDLSGAMDVVKDNLNTSAEKLGETTNDIKEKGFYSWGLESSFKPVTDAFFLMKLMSPFSNESGLTKEQVENLGLYNTGLTSKELLSDAIEKGLITSEVISNLNLTPAEMMRYAGGESLFSLLSPHADEVLSILGYGENDALQNFFATGSPNYLQEFDEESEDTSSVQEAVDQIPQKIEEGFKGAKVQVTVGTGNIVLDSGMLVGALTPKVNVSLGRMLTNS